MKMALLTSKYLLPFLLLPLAVNGNETVIHEESEDIRQPRVTGRIVKVYSGSRPEPILCTSEGFKADPNDCAIFYRCMKSSNEKYTVFRFQCGPGTVYDPDTEVCNHPKSTKRSECGGLTLPSTEENSNEIEEFQREVPRPISTKSPIYAVFSTVKTSTIEPQTIFNPVKDTTKHIDNLVTPATTKIPNVNEYKNNVNFEYPSSTTRHQERVTTTHEPSPKSDICVSEGFMGDSENCHKFYRCVGNQRGSFMKFEYLCSDLTVWDDEIQACNHPWAVKRSRCGRSNMDINDIKKIETTKDSLGFTQTTTDAYKENHISNKESYFPTTYEPVKSNVGNKIEENQISNSDDQHLTTVHVENNKLGQLNQKQESTTATTTVKATTKITQAYSGAENTNNICTTTGFFGDSNDCKKFYRCVDTGKGHYIKHEFSCGEGTVWDQNLEGCNHAWAVPNCGGHTSNTNSNTEHVPTKPSQTSSGSTNGFTETTTVTVIHTTPETDSGEEEEDIGYGNINSSVQTSTTTTTPTTTTTVSNNPASPTLNGCKSSGFHGDPQDCSIFYRCVEDGKGGYTKYEFKCGIGTLWDSTLEACNHANAVTSCNGTSSENLSSTTSSQTTQITTSTQNPTTSSSVTSTSALDQSNEDEDSGYNNQINGVTSTTTTSPVTTSNEKHECKSNGFFGNEHDCKKFYRCVDNGDGTFNKFEFTCGEGTLWDSKIEACNHAWAVDCNGTAVSTSNEINIQVTTNVPEHTSTNKIGTTSMKPIAETTLPSGTSSTISIITSGSSLGTDCKSDGFIGDDTDCRKFYRCVNNGDGTFTKFEFSCGEGTVWDPKIGSCNHAWAVEKCGTINEDQHSSTTGTTPAHNRPTMADEYDGTYTVANVTTASQVTEQVQITPVSQEITNICQESGFVGDKNDCQKFYRCVEDGKGGFTQYEYRCGEGTVWDTNIESCNHAWAVPGCQLGIKPIQTTETSTHKTSTTYSADQNFDTTSSSVVHTTESSLGDSCTTEGFIGDRKDCKKFYRCVQHSQGFIKYEFQCGEGTYWNQEIQACDHTSSNQNCYSQEQEISHNKPPVQNDDIYTEATTGNTDVSHITTHKPESSDNNCVSEGFFGDSSDCKKFYRCVADANDGYIKYEFMCGDSTIWNQEITGCDHPTSENKCLGQTSTGQESNSGQEQTTTSTQIPHSTEEAVTSSIPETTECTSDGFYANPNDCKKFYRCVKDDKGGYVKYDFVCGSGTIWIQEIQACDHDNGIENCSSNAIDSSSSQAQTSTHSYISTTTQISSTIITQSTVPTNVNEQYTTTEKSNVVCSGEGFYANKNDCKKFYRCVDNGQGGYTKYEFTCGDGTAWDELIQGCNHIENVENCNISHAGETQTQETLHDEMPETENGQSTTKVPPSTSTESTDSEDEDSCESEGFFGDSKDCKKFYRCVDNGRGGFTKYEFTCGEGTIWDEDITTCNYPQDVVNPSCSSNGENETISSTESSSSSNKPSASSTSSSTSSQSTSTTESNSSNNSSNSSQDSSSSKPSQNITCTKAGFYPNPNDCKKFYRCVDWDNNGEKFSVFHFECGDGTIWDPALDTCNYEESVYPPRDCTGSQSQNTGQETTTTEQEPTTQTTAASTEESTTQQSTTEQITHPSTTSEDSTTEATSTTAAQTSTQKTTTSTGTTQEQTSTQTTKKQTTTEPSTTQQQTTTQESTTVSSTTQQQTSPDTTTQQVTTADTSATEQQTTESSVTDETTVTSQVTTTQSTTTTEISSTETESSNTTTTEVSTTTQETTTEPTTSESNSTQSTTNSTDESTTTEGGNQPTTTEATSTTEANKDSTTEDSDSSSSATEGTTETSSESSTTSESTTETSSTESGKCPETEDGQSVFVCPTSFRRHPKYCNIFYQCTEDDDTHEVKVATFKCPNNTIYDESQTKCVEQEKANEKCEGEISSRRRLKNLVLNYKEPIIVTRDSQSCPAEGHMPFEKNSECSPGFLKCEKSKQGKLRGMVHQCPQNYVYWSISRRCERKDRVRDCRRTTNNWDGRWEIPIERHNVAW